MEEYRLWRNLDERRQSSEHRYACLANHSASKLGIYNDTHYRRLGTYVPDPTDTSGYNSDKIGISFVTFDSTSGTSGKATPRIFVGVANNVSANLFMSNDAGSTCASVPLF